MRILAVGDVVGECGTSFLLKMLPELKRKEKIDLCIVNGENSAVGNGISPASAKLIFTAGADVITTGNHVFKRKEVYTYLDENPFILRPYNFNMYDYGKGFLEIDLGRERVTVINLMGSAYTQNVNNPFLAADEILEKLKDKKNIIVDFHAEATGEKRAVGFYLDGRVTAFFGTHTHVQTADEAVLPYGTGYITDIGMTGAECSCLGVKSECVIEKLKNSESMVRFKQAYGKAILGGCIFETESGKTTAVKRVLLREE